MPFFQRYSKKKTGSGAFTLLELMVSIGLLSLLILALSMIFTNGLKALRIGYKKAEIYSSVRTALEQMLREIPAALYDGTPSYPFICIPTDGAKYRGTDSNGPELYFVGQSTGAGESDVVELGYWFKRTDIGKVGDLMRFYVTDASPNFDLYQTSHVPDFSTPAEVSNNSYLLAPNIDNLKFKFHYRTALSPQTWSTLKKESEWDSQANIVGVKKDINGRTDENIDKNGNLKNPDGLPDAVEVQITVMTQQEKTKGSTSNPQVYSIYIPLES